MGPGLVILLGIAPSDGEQQARFLAEKTANSRIFEDEQGKMNRSILDVKGAALVVSHSRCMPMRGKAAGPPLRMPPRPIRRAPCAALCRSPLQAQGVPAQTGEFGAHMLVEIANDGPVTIILEV